MLAYKILSFKI